MSSEKYDYISKAKEIISKIVIRPLIEHSTIALLVVGTLLIIYGTFGNGKELSNFAGSLGSAIVGGGIFSVILKTAQFSQLFQHYIFEAVYNPSQNINLNELTNKWDELTEAILAKVLPQAHRDATNYIKNTFFNSELEYHFEDLEIHYELEVLNDNEVNVKSINKSKLVMSPHVENPMFTQDFSSIGDCRIVRIKLNNVELNSAESTFATEQLNGETKQFNLSFPLKKYANLTSDKKEQFVKLERIVETKLFLNRDPYVAAKFGRYIKGLTITANISSGYRLCMIPIGMNIALPLEADAGDDGRGNMQWTLGDMSTVFCPGQAFILAIIKN